VQSILVRVPRIIGAPIGGAILVALGVRAGMRVALAISIVLAGCVVFAQYRGFRADPPEQGSVDSVSFVKVWRRMAPALKRLQRGFSCELGKHRDVVHRLYVTGPLRGCLGGDFGVLYGQQATSVALPPDGQLLAIVGRRWLVAAPSHALPHFPSRSGCRRPFRR
jgi:hypothetical protein